MTLYQGRRVRLALEWKPADLWVGMFVKHYPPYSSDTYDDIAWSRVDVWICLLPMLPIHLTWRYGYLGEE